MAHYVDHQRAEEGMGARIGGPLDYAFQHRSMALLTHAASFTKRVPVPATSSRASGVIRIVGIRRRPRPPKSARVATRSQAELSFAGAPNAAHMLDGGG